LLIDATNVLTKQSKPKEHDPNKEESKRKQGKDTLDLSA
jgi:hypothetical protein